jgi:hypothetical protein
MPERIYIGEVKSSMEWKVYVRTTGGRRRPLPLRLNVQNHSPSGFSWGYSGSGPAQLALAILCDAMADKKRAVRLHQRFKADVIARLDQDQSWLMPLSEVEAWIAEQPETDDA